MSVRVSEMTVDELRDVIGSVVEKKLQGLFDDEACLELTNDLKERLARQTEAVKNGERGVPMEEVMRNLGLN
jgi:hypothetical protein